MGEPNSAAVQNDIEKNMLVSAQRGFHYTNEELEAMQSGQHIWANSRGNRKKAGSLDKKEQQRNTQEWVNRSRLETNIDDVDDNARNFNINEIARGIPAPNNRSSSENIDTIRENIRNSQESLRRKSCENILEVGDGNASRSESLRGKSSENIMEIGESKISRTESLNRKSAENILDIGDGKTSKTNTDQSKCKPSVDGGRGLTLNVQDYLSKGRRESCDSSSSNDSWRQQLSPMSASYKDPHTAAIDLSNNCRQFYFSHLKTAEAIKQSVRSDKHTRALQKMEGKTCSRIDAAMQKLRAEMADLMDQDLSLMSQLLTLNDKIEEVKTHVSRSSRYDSSSQSSCFLSNSDVTDSEMSDIEDSGIDSISERDSAGKHSRPNSQEVDNSMNALKMVENADVVRLRRVNPSEDDIIVYTYKRKGKRRRKHPKSAETSSGEDTGDDTSTEVGSDTAESESDPDESSQSDTESTISYNSLSTNGGLSDGHGKSDSEGQSDRENTDSGIQSPKSSVPKVQEIKPRKGGISQNSNFLNFHKPSGIKTLTGLNSVLTLQGHNISLEKYYVPQGLVYLKHTKSDNVFCQFAH